MNYKEYLKQKSFVHLNAGFQPDEDLIHAGLFDFEKDCVRWACRRGRSAIFADTGLGKTIMQLSWADQVVHSTSRPVLILAPLCVAQQTVREGLKFDIASEYIRSGSSDAMIRVTNYEMLKNFQPENYSGIVLDESSILKGLNGTVRRQITDFASTIPYRLSCTATPSPNDYMELGTQSEFLGIISQTEMLATFFIHDGSDTAKWRLKGHGRVRFWEWLATWAVVIRHPSDLGYSAEGYDLPPLKHFEHIVETDPVEELFVSPAMGLQERNRARKESINDRCAIAAEIANGIDGACIIWCNLNAESELLKKLIRGAVEVTGSDTISHKERSAMGFVDGEIEKLISKPRIYGYGLNLQHCHHIIFVGLSDSWESYYQAIRRCWRFGQTESVEVHIVSADTEGAVVANIKRKEEQNKRLGEEMVRLVRDYTIAEIKGASIERTEYKPSVEMQMPAFGS